jgi:hypothetical protein
LACNEYECIIDEDGMSTLAEDVVCIAAKLAKSNLRAKPSTDLSTPVASVTSHMSISFCKPAT